MDLSLKMRLTGGVTSAFGLVALALVLYLPARLDEVGRRWLELRGTTVATVLAAHVAPGIDFDDAAFIDAALGELKSAPEMRYAVVRRKDGTVLGGFNVPEAPLAGGLPQSSEGLSVGFSSLGLDLERQITTQGGQSGILQLGLSRDDLDAQRSADVRMVLGLSAALFLFGAVLAWVLGEQVVRPIRAVTATADGIASGKVRLGDVRVEDDAWATRRDEGARLAGAVGVMAGRLAKQVGEIAAERERARAAEALATDASTAKSSFLANMSHELRTPLNAIIGYSEMLDEIAREEGYTEAVADLGKIHSAGKHLLALINDILDLSKIEAGKMEVYNESIDLRQLLTEVCDGVEPLVNRKGNKLVRVVGDDVSRLYSDATKTRQVLFNLLSNAAKFCENGTITLRAHRQVDETGKFIVLEVEDDGIGMSPEQQARLFQPFVQADASTTRKYGGTGLGLTISRRFVEMMKGTIVLRSGAGAGTTFIVRLPDTTLASDGNALTPTPRGKRSVLAIDDDPVARELIARTLEREGWFVVTAPDGPSGLQAARRSRPDVITLDVMMPGMDGWSVLAALKADAALCSVPVVMLSMVDDRSRGFALGAVEYLMKPIDRGRLAEVASRHGGKSGPVLIVEDDAGLREIARRELERAGFVVDEAANGQRALDALAGRVPKLILLDLMMPEMDGFEFLERIKANPAWSDVRVVVLTAMDLTSDQRARLGTRVERIVQKGTVPTAALLAEIAERVRLVAPEQT